MLHTTVHRREREKKQHSLIGRRKPLVHFHLRSFSLKIGGRPAGLSHSKSENRHKPVTNRLLLPASDVKPLQPLPHFAIRMARTHRIFPEIPVGVLPEDLRSFTRSLIHFIDFD